MSWGTSAVPSRRGTDAARCRPESRHGRCGRCPARSSPRRLRGRRTVRASAGSRRVRRRGHALPPRPVLTGCACMSMSSWSVKRRPGAVNSGRTSGVADTSTALPFSLPAHSLKSFSSSMTAWTASTVIVPLVPGVHARGNAISGNGCGAITWATSLSFAHPRPKGPHASCAHVADAPLVETLHGPRRCRADVGRVREPGSMHVGQVPQRLHDLGPLEALVLDPVQGVEIDALRAARRGLGPCRGSQRGEDDRAGENGRQRACFQGKSSRC